MRRFSLFSILPLFLGAAVTVPANAELITASKVFALQTAGGTNHFPNIQASNGTDFNSTWCTAAPNGNGNYYNNGTVNPILLFDLETVQTLDFLSLWNYSVHGNAVSEFTLYFYDGSQGFSGTPTATHQVTLDNYTSSQTEVKLALEDPVMARYVKMEMTGNFDSTHNSGSGGDRVGFAELQFNRTNTVSEFKPASVAQIAASGTPHGTHPASNLLDGDSGSGWVTNTSSSDYFNGTNPNPQLEFTFEGAQNISSVSVTPYSESRGNSAKDFNLTFYDASGNQIAVDDPSKYSFKMVTYATNAAQTFTFPEVQGAAKVVMTITDNFKPQGGGSNYGGGDRVGLNEVTFGSHQYTPGPTFQTSYSTPQEGLRVIRPDSVSINKSSYSAANLNNLIAGSGYTKSGTWYSIGRGDDFFNYNVSEQKDVVPVLTFEFDDPQLTEGFLYWGYATNHGNGLTSFEMAFYNDGELVYGDTYMVDWAFSEYEYANFMFDESIEFDKVDMTLLDNAYQWFSSGDGGDRVGFNGLAFYQDPNKVPEPSTWALMLLGGAGLFALRSRKRKA